MRKIKVRKAIEPDGIVIEVWECLGDDGTFWLTNLLNKILNSKKMVDEWIKIH